MKIFNKTKGAVSIFLVIILVPMMTVSSLFVDASKVSLARSVATSAGDLALNTALTDYDTVLKDMYGLFATAQDTDELFSKLEDYYRSCITSSGVSNEEADSYVNQIMAQLGLVAGDNETADILNMELIDFDVSKRTDATLAKSTILKKGIVDFMKYRAPINTGLSFLTSLQSFSTLSKQTELVDKRTEYYQAQETVMKNAQEAWKHINSYNGKGFITSDSYFPTMDSNFLGYENAYQEIAKKTIMDLYDAQAYGSFSPYMYSIASEEVDFKGEKQIVPIFYTNNAKTTKKTIFTEYSTYSDTKKATAENVKQALQDYYTAYNAVKAAQDKLMAYDSNTYGLQYLVQTNRNELYKTWATSMGKLYERYSELRHAVSYGGELESGASIMTTSGKICGSSSSQPYSYYYNKFMSDFDVMAAVFNVELAKHNSTLQSYANQYSTDKSSTETRIANLYSEISGYRTTVSDAKDNLDVAITYLGYVLDGVKSGGSLDQKADEWEQVAGSSDLKNTSMAKQDLTEIDSLSTYLNAEDVQKLITRLSNISTNLGKTLEQIDSYTFFDTKIVEINDYTTFTNILKNKIGDNALKTVPTNKAQLEAKISEWCNGKFVVGNKVNTSWHTQTDTEVKLTTNKLNFYSYLYTHFNTGAVSTNTTPKEPSADNGQNLYDNIKSKGSSAASAEANGADSGNIISGNEIKNKAGLPSSDQSNSTTTPSPDQSNSTTTPSPDQSNSTTTPSASVSTGDTAVSDTSKSLGSMFKNLAAAVDLGTDLRDKLYISDYILSMSSYDTIEKEYLVKNTDKTTAELFSLTNTAINADNNFAYGKEVEYIIYGEKNSLNCTKAYGSIYGIRFGFNLIYAFMDSSIRDGAFAIATPISAATLGVIPVPLIQAAIIIGIACCESAIDLNDIRNGESVPLFKTAETWHCSVNGLINEAKGMAGEAIKTASEYVIDEGTRKLGEVLDMTDEELNKYIESGADELTGYVEDAYDTSITRHANTAIQKLTTLTTNAIEEYALDPTMDMVNYISSKLDAWIAEETAISDSSDIGFIVKSEAVNIIKSAYIQQFIDVLTTANNDAQSAVADMGAIINDKITEIRLIITRTITESSQKVIDYKSQMISKLKDSMGNGADSLKSTLNDQIDGIFGSGATSGADNTGIASLLSFSYSDYLRLFLMVGLYTNEEAVILRTADVIQVNLAETTSNTDYRLNNSAVYVKLSATIQVKPTLLALPLFADVEGNPSSNSNWYTITINDIRGY